MLHLLRTFHVLGGVIWVGTLVFIAFFLLPAARSLGPAAGPFINHLMQVRKLPVYMQTVGLVTVVTGYWLYWHNAVNNGTTWLASGQGRAFGIGAILATVGWLWGVMVIRPTAKKIGIIAAQMALPGATPTPETMVTLSSLQARMGKVSLFIAILLVCATVAMAIARYTT